MRHQKKKKPRENFLKIVCFARKSFTEKVAHLDGGIQVFVQRRFVIHLLDECAA